MSTPVANAMVQVVPRASFRKARSAPFDGTGSVEGMVSHLIQYPEPGIAYNAYGGTNSSRERVAGAVMSASFDSNDALKGRAGSLPAAEVQPLIGKISQQLPNAPVANFCCERKKGTIIQRKTINHNWRTINSSYRDKLCSSWKSEDLFS